MRLGEVAPDDKAVVIGGGPIGLLNALVARRAGAEVCIAEVNEYRLEIARSLGLETVNPLTEDLVAHVEAWTEGGGADVVFEVSGSAPGAEIMTQLPRTRGRIVVVAIFAQPPQVDLFRFFWRELKLCGVRVYEPEDYDQDELEPEGNEEDEDPEGEELDDDCPPELEEALAEANAFMTRARKQ